jgi:hypothetical protein
MIDRLAGLAAVVCAGMAAARADAGLPQGLVVVTSVASVDLRALPGMLALDSGTFSALELAESFALAVNPGSDAALSHTVGERGAQAVDPTTFVPPSSSARYYDPTLRDTVPARVLEAAAAGEEARFEVGGGTRTLTELLRPAGAVLVFTVQAVPEPGLGPMLMVGVLWLVGRRGAESGPSKRASMQGPRDALPR